MVNKLLRMACPSTDPRFTFMYTQRHSLRHSRNPTNHIPQSEMLLAVFLLMVPPGVRVGNSLNFRLEWASLVAQTVKNPPSVQETWVQSLGWEDFPEEGNGNPLQYTCLGNPMDRGAWQAIWSTGSQRVGHK